MRKKNNPETSKQARNILKNGPVFLPYLITMEKYYIYYLTVILKTVKIVTEQ